MDFSFIETFIRAESLIMVPVLYLIGLFLRQTPRVAIWMHAWIKLIIASISCFLYYGLNIQAFVQAVLVTGAAVLMKDLIHKTANQITTKEEDQNH